VIPELIKRFSPDIRIYEIKGVIGKGSGIKKTKNKNIP
jgi:hypothetical protein